MKKATKDKFAEEIKEKKTLQTSILRKFLGREEFNKLLASYQSLSTTRSLLGNELSKPLSLSEKRILKKFFENRNLSLRNFAKEMGVSPAMSLTRLRNATLKIVYQNQEILKVDKLLE